jgi:hypothetical protein
MRNEERNVNCIFYSFYFNISFILIINRIEIQSFFNQITIVNISLINISIKEPKNMNNTGENIHIFIFYKNIMKVFQFCILKLNKIKPTLDYED